MDKNTLISIRESNNALAWASSDWLCERSQDITCELLQQTDPEGEVPQEELYRALFAAFNDLETIDPRMIRCLDASVYRENPYYKNIELPRTVSGDWEFTWLCYEPFETFLCDDILTLEDTREIPRMGYFTEKFSYPAVLQNGREWMAVKPSEIESMAGPLETISGKVVTFGLGLGYFAYMASIKPDVQSVTVVEKDATVISLFEKYILPQFSQKDKIQIVQSDAFEYMETSLAEQGFDYAFVDIWHDSADGLDLYMRTKPYEKLSPRTQFLYWVENTLLSALRWKLFDMVLAACPDAESAMQKLSNASLSRLAAMDIIR